MNKARSKILKICPVAEIKQQLKEPGKPGIEMNQNSEIKL